MEAVSTVTTRIRENQIRLNIYAQKEGRANAITERLAKRAADPAVTLRSWGLR